MNLLDLVLILLITTVIYLIYKGMTSNNYNQNNNNNDQMRGLTPYSEHFDGKAADENYIYDDTIPDNSIRKGVLSKKKKRKLGIDDLDIEADPNYIDRNKQSQKEAAIKLKDNFLDIQFHNDYRDTMTAFSDIAPDQKQIFNIANAPTRLTNPPHKEVGKIVKDFINLINRDVQYNVADYRGNNTGWDEPLPQIKEKSGWEKQMEELGLPTSLYADPAKRAPVVLIKIDYVEKYVTEFETQYIIILIVQKVNVNDQMIIRISFVRENNNIDDERKFFDDIDADYCKNNYTNGPKKVNSRVSDPSSNEMVIEEIFVVGFLTNEGIEGEKSVNYDKLDFYEFKGLETTDIIDQHTIAKELIQKRLQQQKEMMSFTASLDEEDRNFHNELPAREDYKSYKCTRTVLDDLTNQPIEYD